jgi:Fe-S-cluster-containing dehydrogenase component/DMSO reductase anchor subunit
VAKFSRAHERGGSPAQARYYRDLIPLERPRAGQQYAFEVDLDQCSGCKACVTACHSLNGLEDDETWRNVGLLHGGSFLQPIQRTVTTACHHCVDPACANGCPVLAYEKDPVTGIVRHLDDQCIGCRYCVLKCPYDVPKYSERLGIVRKCDMCSNRLASGEAPACVQACPNEAIRITVVEQKAPAATYRETVSATNPFLPGSPAPGYTLPTTRYVSAEPLDESLGPADAHEVRPQCAHTPLGIMLVLSQLSVGMFAVERLISATARGPVSTELQRGWTLTALVVGLAALGTSTMHLGRPLGAWRAFLGLRKSWLSREIIAFGIFAKLAILHTALVWFPGSIPFPPPWNVGDIIGLATVGFGLVGVFCSAMIYHDTRRDFWRLPRSGGKFLGTTALLGTAGSLVLVIAVTPGAEFVTALAAATLSFGALKLSIEWPIFRRLEIEDYSPLYKTALLLAGELGPLHRWRVACGVVGGILVPAVVALQMLSAIGSPRLLSIEAGIAFALCLAGELIERRLFFVAVQPVTMPGGVSA